MGNKNLHNKNKGTALPREAHAGCPRAKIAAQAISQWMLMQLALKQCTSNTAYPNSSDLSGRPQCGVTGIFALQITALLSVHALVQFWSFHFFLHTHLLVKPTFLLLSSWLLQFSVAGFFLTLALLVYMGNLSSGTHRTWRNSHKCSCTWRYNPIDSGWQERG